MLSVCFSGLNNLFNNNFFCEHNDLQTLNYHKNTKENDVESLLLSRKTKTKT